MPDTTDALTALTARYPQASGCTAVMWPDMHSMLGHHVSRVHMCRHNSTGMSDTLVCSKTRFRFTMSRLWS